MSLISVIIPCYNQAQYMDECLQSVLDQTFTDWECIIVNDGSPDNTEEIAKRWIEKDNRFIYLAKKKGGVSSARNAGLEIAKGEWIQFLDCDDLIVKEKFQISSDSFANYDFVLSNYFYFSKKSKNIGYKDFHERQINYNFLVEEWDHQFIIPIHCPIFRRKKMNKNFNTFLKAKEDWIFWLDFFKNNPEVKYIEEPLAYYRNNANSVTKDDDLMTKQDVIAHLYIYDHLSEEEKRSFFEKRIFNKIRESSLAMRKRNEFFAEIQRISEKLESNRYKFIDKIFNFFGK